MPKSIWNSYVVLLIIRLAEYGPPPPVSPSDFFLPCDIALDSSKTIIFTEVELPWMYMFSKGVSRGLLSTLHVVWHRGCSEPPRSHLPCWQSPHRAGFPVRVLSLSRNGVPAATSYLRWTQPGPPAWGQGPEPLLLSRFSAWLLCWSKAGRPQGSQGNVCLTTGGTCNTELGHSKFKSKRNIFNFYLVVYSPVPKL